jgi:hypothetical protein
MLIIQYMKIKINLSFFLSALFQKKIHYVVVVFVVIAIVYFAQRKKKNSIILSKELN